MTVVIEYILGGYLIELGIEGMGINMIIVHLINLVMIIVYSYRQGFLSLSLVEGYGEVVEGMWEYSKYVLQITVISYSDQLSFEIMTLMCASLSEVLLAAHVSLGQFYEFIAALPLAYHVALSNQTAEKLAQHQY